MSVAPERIRTKNARDVRDDGAYVLYWMTSNRRLSWNYALDRAVEHARKLQRPVLILEALRCGYRWASVRHHRFVLEGMRANERAAASMPACRYFPYVEERAGDGSGLLEALAERACVVVGDDFPCFFLPRMQEAAAGRLGCRFEIVDSNGLYPMAASERVFTTAHSFRRHLQKELAPWLAEAPVQRPLRGSEPDTRGLARVDKRLGQLQKRWPRADLEALLEHDGLEALGLDDVAPAPFEGGAPAARATLRDFLDARLERYADERNKVEDSAASGLSPWLHFGHISAHEVFHELTQREDWSQAALAHTHNGKREGWWGMSRGAESFLDEIVTWREIGLNCARNSEAYDSFSQLPDWARETLRVHARDERPELYSESQLEAAQTHDEVWNAAQRQLVREGRMHNYLRMLWGKKVLEWSPKPERAAEILIELNNKYAVDGRDPNSYSGIFWVFGRYDRAWGERPIFGKVRYMSSESTRRKLDLRAYLERYRA